MMFRVGQEVECIDDVPRGGWMHPGLIKGRVYVIDSFGTCRDGITAGPTFNFNKGWAYWPDRFRPIVKRKTDISIFTAMLTPSKQGVSA